jgi:hypothetical protein
MCLTCVQPFHSHPTMALLIVALWMAGSTVLIALLMFKIAQSFMPRLHGNGFLFLSTWSGSLFSFLFSLNYQLLIVSPDRIVKTTSCHLLWFPTKWWSKWRLLFLAERTNGCHLFRFPLVWRNKWQAKSQGSSNLKLEVRTLANLKVHRT